MKRSIIRSETFYALVCHLTEIYEEFYKRAKGNKAAVRLVRHLKMAIFDDLKEVQ